MKVVVVGASGTMGKYVSDRLEQRDVEVVRAHRGSGVDAQSGTGLADALDGAEMVVDCLNVTTQSARKAKMFFSTAAGNIADAATAAGARVVCLSICNAADPAVNRRMGYYQGKAAQEAVYRDRLDDRLTIVRTTQWFELADTVSKQLSLGPVAVLPHMMTAPLAAADGAEVIVEQVLQPGPAVLEVRGPRQLDLVEVARALWAARGEHRIVVPIRFGGAAMRNGGLIPDHPDVTTETTLDQWLTASAGAPD